MRGPGALSPRAALPLAGPDALRPRREPRQRSPAGPAGAAGQGRARRAAPPRGAGGLRPQPERLSPAHREKPLEGLCDPVKFSERIKTSKGLGGAPAHFVPRRGKLGARRGQGRAGPARGRQRSEDRRAAMPEAVGPCGRPHAPLPAAAAVPGRALSPARRDRPRGPSAPGPGRVRLPPPAARRPGEPVPSGEARRRSRPRSGGELGAGRESRLLSALPSHTPPAAPSSAPAEGPEAAGMLRKAGGDVPLPARSASLSAAVGEWISRASGSAVPARPARWGPPGDGTPQPPPALPLGPTPSPS
ncbi:PREDICTED: translation initiation factor IF-2-like [Pseudopodoces humilis]|uniref:translation initiation factor IF-2-like n=1 Tax=Pseudopodoces humilis TaxID=181119 RepID=UPI000395ADC3|nr:PREDICTED: translation initiation factor IF-2-like [Pseudopodoces humilis]